MSNLKFGGRLGAVGDWRDEEWGLLQGKVKWEGYRDGNFVRV